MTELDLDAIEVRATVGVRQTAADADVLALVARVRELEQQISDVSQAASVIHAHRFDADRRDDPDHAAWLASFGEAPAKRPDMFYAGVEYAVKRIREAIVGESL